MSQETNTFRKDIFEGGQDVETKKEGSERLREIYAGRHEFVASCPDDVVAGLVAKQEAELRNLDIEGLAADDADTFQFAYFGAVSKRMTDISHHFIGDIDRSSFFTGVSYYKQQLDRLAHVIEDFRGNLQQAVGQDIPRSFTAHHSPRIEGTTGLQHRNKKNGIGDEMVRMVYGSLQKTAQRYIDSYGAGNISVEEYHWLMKSLDDQLREDHYFFQSLLTDIDNGKIRRKADLRESIVATHQECAKTEKLFRSRMEGIKDSDAYKSIRFSYKEPNEGESSYDYRADIQDERSLGELLEALGASLSEYENAVDKAAFLKKRYREMLKVSHPDKFERASEEDRERATKRTQEIIEAYQALRKKIGL